MSIEARGGEVVLCVHGINIVVVVSVCSSGRGWGWSSIVWIYGHTINKIHS